MKAGGAISNMPMDFFAWYESHDDKWRQCPWLVLGKGPSFALAGGVEKGVFNVFGLNHVVQEVKLDVAHMIDLEVVAHCADFIDSNAGFLLMPWVPHVRNRPGKLTLNELLPKYPILSRLASEGRLLWYNKVGCRSEVPLRPGSPSVRVLYFSAEAAYALLGTAGAKTIRSLGIDGGDSYAANFTGLNKLLANGWKTFDKQFQEIAKSIMRFNLDAAPLNLQSPVRIFVATTEEQMLSVKVLEYSIRKRASMSVEVVALHDAGVNIPWPIDRANWPRTPFSFQRFIIPQITGYQGRAIYLDSDMQVFGDIRQLWECDMGDNDLLSAAALEGEVRAPQYSVMLMACDKLRWNIIDIVGALDSGELNYASLMFRMEIVEKQESCISPEWNSLERYQEGRTKLVHYTDMNTQPWIYALHPFGHLWVRDLIDAVDDGFISRDYVHEHVRNGWVRPTLSYQVENRIVEASLLPADVLRLDANYSPPYHKLHRQKLSLLVRGRRYLSALIRRQFSDSAILARIRYIRSRKIF